MSVVKYGNKSHIAVARTRCQLERKQNSVFACLGGFHIHEPKALSAVRTLPYFLSYRVLLLPLTSGGFGKVA